SENLPHHGAACRPFPPTANIATAACHGGYVTRACGVTIYNGTALPNEYRGNAFVCEPAGNLVHRDVLVPDGVTFIAKRAYATNEFLASADNWFRPVNLATGPDGALYVCDMYRKTIEHPEYLPVEVRKRTDFISGRDLGRIWRVGAPASLPARSGFPQRAGRDAGAPSSVENAVHRTSSQPRPFLNLARARIAELVQALGHPNAWQRETAQ